jgi:hypothetical protein
LLPADQQHLRMPKSAPKKPKFAAEFKAAYDDADRLFALAQSRPLDLPLQNKIINRLYTLVKKSDGKLWWDLWYWKKGRFGKYAAWSPPSPEELDPRLRRLAIAVMRAAITKAENKPEGHAGVFNGLSDLAPDAEVADICRAAVLDLPLGSYQRFNGVADCLRKCARLPGRKEIQLLGAQRFLDAQAEVAQAYTTLKKKKLSSDWLDPLWAIANCSLVSVLADRLRLADEVSEALADRVLEITNDLMVLRDALGDTFRVVGVRRLRRHLPILPDRFAQYVDLRGEWRDMYHIIATEIAVAWARLDPPGAKTALTRILAQRRGTKPEDRATRSSCLAGLLALPKVDKAHIALVADFFADNPGSNGYALVRAVGEGRVSALKASVKGFEFEEVSLDSTLEDRLEEEKKRTLAVLRR